VLSGPYRSLVRHEANLNPGQQVTLTNIPLGPYFLEDEGLPPILSFRTAKRIYDRILNRPTFKTVSGGATGVVLTAENPSRTRPSPLTQPIVLSTMTGAPPIVVPQAGLGAYYHSYGFDQYTAP